MAFDLTISASVINVLFNIILNQINDLAFE